MFSRSKKKRKPFKSREAEEPYVDDMDTIANSASYILNGHNSNSCTDVATCVTVFAPGLPHRRTLWNAPVVAGFLTLVRMFGGFPFCSLNCVTKNHLPVSSLWNLVLFLITMGVGFVDTLKSIMRYRNRVSSLEFTAIALTVYRACYIVRALIIISNMYFLRKKLHLLFVRVNQVCMVPEMDHRLGEVKQIRQRVQQLAGFLSAVGLSAVVTLIAACYLCFRGIALKITDEDRPCGWTCITTFPIIGELPMWVTFVAYVFGFFWEVGIDVFPQLVIFLLIYPLGLRFRNFTTLVKEKLHADDIRGKFKCKGPVTSLRNLVTVHLELTTIVRDFDKAFSFMFFLMYMNDLMGFIATVSLILHHSHGLSVNSIDYELIPVFLALVGVSSFHAILRTGFGVWLSEKAHSVLPYLYQLNLRVTSEEEKFLCASFISRLQGSRVALTSGGFFYITREFVITMFGVLLTYVLFVYQMQDQKSDMSLLPKLEEIAAVAFASYRTSNHRFVHPLLMNSTW